MRYIICLVALLAFAACNDSQQAQRLKDLATHDSLMTIRSQKKDSIIDQYIGAINEIQDNLDSIKSKEKILTVTQSGEPVGKSAVADIKALDKLILRNNKDIYRLELRLKKMDKKDAAMEKMLAHLTNELAKKDKEIEELQGKLSRANDSLRTLTIEFRDSVAVINRQRSEINAMKDQVNTVYYAIGTNRELRNKAIIDKKGGFLGMGRTAELNPDVDIKGFSKGNMTNLHAIALNGKFSRIVTSHPNGSYKISASGDTLTINDASSFWSESKYLVIEIK